MLDKGYGRITQKPPVHLQIMTKAPTKFQKDRYKTIRRVAPIRYPSHCVFGWTDEPVFNSPIRLKSGDKKQQYKENKQHQNHRIRRQAIKTTEKRELKSIYLVQSNLDSSNTDGSFTMANSNSFLSPYEILPIV